MDWLHLASAGCERFDQTWCINYPMVPVAMSTHVVVKARTPWRSLDFSSPSKAGYRHNFTVGEVVLSQPFLPSPPISRSNYHLAHVAMRDHGDVRVRIDAPDPIQDSR